MTLAEAAFVGGTTIVAADVNSDLSDIASEMTDSLSRSGKGGMTAPLRVANGSAAAPSYAFTNDTGVGIYRKSSGVGALVAGSNEALSWDSTGVLFTRTAFPLGTGWTNGSPAPRYYKLFGRVWLEGSVSVPINGSGTSTNSATMPSGFRPVGLISFPVGLDAGSPITGGEIFRMNITSAGVVGFDCQSTVSATVTFSLNGISWVADN